MENQEPSLTPQSPSPSSRDARPDLDALARHLVHHPRAAAREGMGALATMLADHSGLVDENWDIVFILVPAEEDASATAWGPEP